MLDQEQSANLTDRKKLRERFKMPRWHKYLFLLIVYDFVAIHIAYFFGLWLRFDFVYSQIPGDFFQIYRSTITLYAVLAVIVFYFFHLYQSIWRFASLMELEKVLEASLLTSAMYTLITVVAVGKMPWSYHFIGALLQIIFISMARFAYRFVLYLRNQHSASKARDNETIMSRVMVIGAGSAGQMLIRDMVKSELVSDKAVCIIDDNPDKWNRYIDGVPVVGGRDEIMAAVERYKVDKIFFSIPSATPSQKRDILNICKETDCELKQLPGMYQFVLDQISIKALKDVSVEDLLGREKITANMTEVYNYVSGKVVLVTGGGGSIGSELCRQVAAHDPKQLILVDIYENSVYDVQLELKEKYPNLDLQVLIGSVRDSRRMFEIFDQYRPNIVYHAAAHKHVPLMEESPCEAIKNNTIGTYKTAYAAMIHGCERFVLISTDKAVNPTNIMGASKRLCEMIIQGFDAKIKQGKVNEIPQLFTHSGIENADKDGTGRVFRDVKTEFVAVRFGNVLGSNGSVIPVFKKQIEKGGPITVTHPEIIRYFMTIPEAVSLVMVAGTYAKGGEIFVLDMGDPVKIETLARNMIRLSGLRPDVDIKIEYSGLRPGEKLFEEKLMSEEGLRKTQNELIYIGKPIPFDVDRFFQALDRLMNAAYANTEAIEDLVGQVVTTYHPAKPEEEQAS